MDGNGLACMKFDMFVFNKGKKSGIAKLSGISDYTIGDLPKDLFVW